MKNKVLSVVIWSFIVFIVVKYISALRVLTFNDDGWIVGDWLINYSSGFVRRGLSGELFLSISQLIKVKPNYVVWVFESIVFLVYLFILIKFLLKKTLNIWFVLFVFSPAALLFPIYFNEAAGRKEILLIATYALFVYLIDNNKAKKQLFYYFFSFLLGIVTLFHELVIFYLPYFILALYLFSIKNKEHLPIKKAIITISGSLIAFMFIFLFGMEIHGNALCSNLQGYGLSENVCSGILKFSYTPKLKGLFKIYEENNYLVNYLLSLELALIPLIVFYSKLKNSIISSKRILQLFSLVFIYSLPLFVVAIDWGRWINIHILMLAFTSLIILKNKQKEKRFIFDVNLPNMNTRNLLIIVLFSFVYLTFWRMNYWFDYEVFTIEWMF